MLPEIQNFLNSCGFSLTQKPLYRIVWSSTELELRIGEFNEYSGSIYLRTVKGARTVPKYPYIKDRWVLEKFFPPEVAYTESLPATRSGAYEPLFVFQDKYGNALPVTIKALEILIAFDRKSQASSVQKSCEDRTLAELAETREFNEILDSIDVTDIQSLLHSREAIIRP